MIFSPDFMTINASPILEPLSFSKVKQLAQTAFGCPRDFLGNRFVYAVISPRARGLSIGVNMNPDKKCNFDCPYCEVHRYGVSAGNTLHMNEMAAELQATLDQVRSGKIRELSFFR